MVSYDPTVSFPHPWPGGWWRLRDIVDYELIALRSLFTLGARYREWFLQNQVAIGREHIEAGAEGAPYAWLVPAQQRDPGSAARMLEVLHATGVEVHEATAPFTADGLEHPAGTRILFAAQPFRPHLKDMMERQVLPERRQYEGGPPEAPYDSAGWTLPVQMGVKSVEVVAPFESSLERIDKVVAGSIWPADAAASPSYITRRLRNADYKAVNAVISFVVYHVAAFITLVGIIALPVLWIVAIVSIVRGAVAASRGEYFRYPMTLRFL